EDDARVQGGAFDGGKQFILRRGLEIPAESNAAKVGIYKHGAITIVPGDTEQAGLPGAIVFQAAAESRHIGPGARSDGLKNIADSGKAGLNAGSLRVHAALNHAAYAGNQTHGRSDSDDARRGSNDVDDVFAAAPGADGIPMRVKRADRNWDTGLQTELLRPTGREPACELIGRSEFTVDFLAYSRE